METIKPYKTPVNIDELLNRIQVKRERLAIQYNHCIIGFLIPVEHLKPEMNRVSRHMTISTFNSSHSKHWERLEERLENELDCMFLTSHGLWMMAIVSPKFAKELGVDDIESLIVEDEVYY